ncbi:MAG: flagellar basal body P-ring protein FlgI [Candidatus Eisenbacteria bacterium]|uniref:Flagellar P-ring protein n=1 Tax=Eiseniibacteriota bacterium TaxID=2212470 RepID=A0A933W9P7_UNCEI|nr:flagellar basal body P-ring protein FlgI [Candidatus Eisenbacteria bacterium]
MTRSFRPTFVRACAALLLALAAFASTPAGAQTPARVSDLTLHTGNVPRRIVGYGIVTGLDGSGDRSFGNATGSTPSVRSVVNLLRRFHLEVPPEQLRLRDVAAVLVTAEVSPYLRAGGRFDVQVSALGDASSLRGGVLWMTPLVEDPNAPPVATAQGNLYLPNDGNGRALGRRSNSARVPQGGLMELDPERVPVAERRLLLRQPDLPTASRIAAAINAAFGEGTAKVDDPGSLTLQPKAGSTETDMGFLAAVDTVAVLAEGPARIVIDGREGTIVAGGGIQLGPAVIHHQGVTLQIGGRSLAQPDSTAARSGIVRVDARSSVQEVATGLHAAGVRPEDMAAIFESLRASGALVAEVVVR